MSPHRTQSSARSSEHCATARTLGVWYRLLTKAIIILNGCGAVFVRDGSVERTSATMATQEQEQNGPRICSDFFYMSEDGVSTPMLALKSGRSGRMAATALEQKGLTQYGVKFFAGFIQQTGVRRFINKSDGEPAMKALKDAAAKANRRGFCL